MTPAHRDALATDEPSPALCDSVPVLQHCLFPVPEHGAGEGKWDLNKHSWPTHETLAVSST